MRSWAMLVFGAVCTGMPLQVLAQDSLALVRKAAQVSTLDQPRTHPFHLIATLAPSFERDNSSGRTGEIEIWWQAPGVYRRELRSPGFHQVAIVNAGRVWQTNEGDYMPAWLDEMADALLHPLPMQSNAMRGIAPDKSSESGGGVYLNWEKPLPMDMQPPKQVVAITESTGLLFYDGGLDWGAEFKDYHDFHGREVARTLTTGSPEVTAKVVMLQDLPEVRANWFDATAPGGDPHPLRIVGVDSTNLASDVVAPVPLVWPEVGSTPRTGVVWADLVLDRAGRIREPFSTISDNPAINGFTHDYLAGLQFKPVLRDGEPVEVVRHVVLRFELRRPAGVEDLGTAHDAFARGHASFLSAAATAPYTLRASVTIKLSSGEVHGTYTDLWKDAHHWRREAVIATGHFVRAEDGDQQYLLQEGAQAGLARLILTVVEPVPALDTMTESDWSLQRDTISGGSVVRVLRGAPPPDNKLDPKIASSAYWFDASGRLLQAYNSHLALSYTNWQLFEGAAVPRLIVGRVSQDGGAVLQTTVDELNPLDPATLKKNAFRIPGHEWKRQFTGETR